MATTDALNTTIMELFTRSGSGNSDENVFTSTLLSENGYLLQSATNDYGTSSSTSWTEFDIPSDNSIVSAWLRGNAVGDGTQYPDVSTEWLNEVNQDVLANSLTTLVRVTTRDLLNYDTAGGASLSIITEGETSPTETHSYEEQNLDLKDEVFITPLYRINSYLETSICEWGSVTSFSDGATEKTFDIERGNLTVAEIMIPENSVIIEASFDVLYKDYVPPINYQQNASYIGLNTTYFYDVSLNDTLSYNVPADWNVEWLAIYIENITVDGIETTLGDVNISAEHNSTTIQFENRSNSAIFWNNIIDMTASPLDFDILTSTMNVMVNLSFKVSLTKTLPVTWQNISEGYDILVPLTSPDSFNLTNPRLFVGVPNMSYGEMNSFIDETAQQMNSMFTHEAGEYVVFNLSENTIIGTVWGSTDENTTMNIDIDFYSEYLTLRVGNTKDSMMYEVQSPTNLWISGNLTDSLNNVLLKNEFCDSYIPIEVTIPNTGTIIISNINISFKTSTVIYGNTFHENAVGSYHNNSNAHIINNIFTNNSKGVILNNSFMYIYSNNISGAEKGIQIINSSCDILWNDIHSNDVGITSEGQSDVNVNNNTIELNNVGIKDSIFKTGKWFDSFEDTSMVDNTEAVIISDENATQSGMGYWIDGINWNQSYFKEFGVSDWDIIGTSNGYSREPIHTYNIVGTTSWARYNFKAPVNGNYYFWAYYYHGPSGADDHRTSVFDGTSTRNLNSFSLDNPSGYWGWEYLGSANIVSDLECYLTLGCYYHTSSPARYNNVGNILITRNKYFV